MDQLDSLRDPFPTQAVSALGGVGGAAIYQDPQFTAFAWQINFLSFALVYTIATMCWLCFDSTKPLVDHD